VVAHQAPARDAVQAQQDQGVAQCSDAEQDAKPQQPCCAGCEPEEQWHDAEDQAW
jgi:hypothetical protein